MGNTSNNTVKRNQSVMRLLDIIEVMARHREPIKQNELAKKLGMAVPTVYRFLLTLMEAGYVKQDKATLKYYLTLKICELSNMVHESINIREVAYPVLKELAAQCQEAACLVIEDDLMAVYVDKVEGPDNMIQVVQRIGKRAPLYCTGVGKLFLSQMNEATFRKVMDRGMCQLTPKTITDEKVLLQILDKVRAQGYAIDDEECELGARCLAVPIYDYTGRIVAAISIYGPSSRMTDQKIDSKKKYVLEASRTISETLGYSGETK